MAWYSIREMVTFSVSAGVLHCGLNGNLSVGFNC